MAPSIEVSASAEDELDAHVEYYEQQVKGLGIKFRATVRNVLETLHTFPVMQVRYDAIRCVPVSGFPYMIHYSFIESRNVVRVHAVIHTARNPATNWNNDNWIVSEPQQPAYGLHEFDLEYYYAA